MARFYEYDALDCVSSMTYKSGTTVLEAYTYSYDKNNNIIKKTEKNSTAKEEKRSYGSDNGIHIQCTGVARVL